MYPIAKSLLIISTVLVSLNVPSASSMDGKEDDRRDQNTRSHRGEESQSSCGNFFKNFLSSFGFSSENPSSRRELRQVQRIPTGSVSRDVDINLESKALKECLDSLSGVSPFFDSHEKNVKVPKATREEHEAAEMLRKIKELELAERLAELDLQESGDEEEADFWEDEGNEKSNKKTQNAPCPAPSLQESCEEEEKENVLKSAPKKSLRFAELESDYQDLVKTLCRQFIQYLEKNRMSRLRQLERTIKETKAQLRTEEEAVHAILLYPLRIDTQVAEDVQEDHAILDFGLQNLICEYEELSPSFDINPAIQGKIKAFIQQTLATHDVVDESEIENFLKSLKYQSTSQPSQSPKTVLFQPRQN